MKRTLPDGGVRDRIDSRACRCKHEEPGRLPDTTANKRPPSSKLVRWK